MRRGILALVAALAASPATAFEAVGPTLGAASNFGQHWQPEALTGAEALGVTYLRDEVIWNHVAQADGTLAFDTMREAYPEMLTARGLTMMLLGYSGHPAVEGGRLPRTPEGQAAFASYHAEIAERFALVQAMEVGNEFNSEEFAREEGWPEDLQARAALYVDLLAETKRALQTVRPGLPIIGGATHSVPLAWIAAVAEAGGAEQMDAFALHPYTSAPEQIARQIALMREIPGFAEMPIAVTEFGTPDAAEAPGYLLRMYCQMAIGGVTQAIWYPMSPRGDGMAPLVDEHGAAQPVGQTYALIRAHLEGRTATDVAPDPFTYACRFGPRALVIWGAPRGLEMAPGLRALTATGEGAEAPLALSRSAPLLILSPEAPIRLGDNVTLGAQTLRADSFDQFGQISGPDAPGLSVMVRRDEKEMPLELRPGQDRGGVPWTPYLGFEQDGEVRVGPDWAMPSSWGAQDPLEIAWRFRAEAPERLRLSVEATPDPESRDGMTLSLWRDGNAIEARDLEGKTTRRTPCLDLAPGATLEARLGPKGDAHGDGADIRIRVERCE